MLVVIAIIGLLSTLSIVALNNARARSRDARRLSDIKQMQTALELYFNDVGTYPLNDIMASDTIASSGQTYMKLVPDAPTPLMEIAAPLTRMFIHLGQLAAALTVLLIL